MFKWKILIFSKTSIQSFVYELINFFMFPDDVVKEIYEKKWNSLIQWNFKTNEICFKI